MSREIQLPAKPEEEELRLKTLELEGLQRELIDQELCLASLRAELATFEKLYIKTVGALYAELDDIEAQIAEAIARHNPESLEASATAREARRKAEESSSAVDEPLSEGVKTDFKSSPELKSLYREVARRVHPDLASNSDDRTIRQTLMAQANHAYETGDEARLRAILDEYDSSPDSVVGEGIAAELVRVIRKIAQVKRRLVEIDLTSPSFCTTANERVYTTTSSGKGANGGSQGAVG
ncbi:MAG: J domain-containing protein, partial [Candidatus Acidiferrum sp.]